MVDTVGSRDNSVKFIISFFPRNGGVTVHVAFPSSQLGVATWFVTSGMWEEVVGVYFWARAFETAGEPSLCLPPARAWVWR